jgi:PPOX class probable F420-dependent enzyme
MTRVMTDAERAFVVGTRSATLGTIAADGRPRLVPICFVVIDDVVWSPLDEKPKRVSDVRELARVRDIEARPEVTLLVDRWSEGWSELAWLRIDGRARVVESDPTAVAALRAKYPQYEDHDLESRPMIAIRIERVNPWGAISSSR